MPTTKPTTTAVTTKPADGPTAPPLDEIDGDTILILSDDKAMLHKWPLGGAPFFEELQHNYNDIYSKFDFNGYWVKETVYNFYRNYINTTTGSSTGNCFRILVNRFKGRLLSSIRR